MEENETKIKTYADTDYKWDMRESDGGVGRG